MTGWAEVRRPDLFERIMERLMPWHDPDAERERAERYEATRQRAVAVRKRSELVLASYDGESRAVARARRRAR